MCGRFTLADIEGLEPAFPWLEVPKKVFPRYNIAPTQPVAVAANDGKNKLDFFLWGLIPFWAKDPKIGARMINARAETLIEKPAYKSAFKYRRCLILADGFYEWKTGMDGTKTPYLFRLSSGAPFAFAGIWERWMSPYGDEVLSCAIITTAPNALVKTVHDRMPVILKEGDYHRWLEQDEGNPRELFPLLTAYPADEMTLIPVSGLVNNSRIDQPECVLPEQSTLL